MAEGWNLISSYISPGDPEISSVLSTLGSNLLVAKNSGGSVYIPAESINQIRDWNPDEGYVVYVSDDGEMTLTGSALNVTRAIFLNEGWNLLPFYPRSAMDVETALASIESKIVMVKDQQGNSYIPSSSDTINEIGTLQPGRAYKIFLNEATSFSYPSQ
jgi:hypothetical protein